MSCEEARELRALLNRERDNHVVENQKALEVVMKLQTLLREVAQSGVELDDNRMQYLVVQIDRVTWDKVREAVTLDNDEKLKN